MSLPGRTPGSVRQRSTLQPEFPTEGRACFTYSRSPASTPETRGHNFFETSGGCPSLLDKPPCGIRLKCNASRVVSAEALQRIFGRGSVWLPVLRNERGG